MFKVFLTNEPNGFPIEIDGFFKFMQDGYNMPLDALAKAMGNMCIIDGVVESGTPTVVSNGFAVVNNELVFFIGAQVQATFDVTEAVSSLIFKGGTSKPVLKTKVAAFNLSGSGAYQYSDLKRIQTTSGNGIAQRLARIEKMLKPLLPYEAGGVTVYGSWLFWGRPASEIPDGWEAVPDEDLKGKVLVGLDAANTNFQTVGQTGGEETHELTLEEIPQHQHTIPAGDPGLPFAPNSYYGTEDLGSNYDQEDWTQTTYNNKRYLTSKKGGLSDGTTKMHNNLQPYRVVLYIRFIG